MSINVEVDLTQLNIPNISNISLKRNMTDKISSLRDFILNEYLTLFGNPDEAIRKMNSVKKMLNNYSFYYNGEYINENHRIRSIANEGETLNLVFNYTQVNLNDRHGGGKCNKRKKTKRRKLKRKKTQKKKSKKRKRSSKTKNKSYRNCIVSS